ncbi:7713_t:CDS:1, partial [Gigaspora margarita]
VTNSKSNQHNISNKKISNTTKLLTQENLLSQDDVLLPIDIFFQDDNELSNVEYKVKELYSLMDLQKLQLTNTLKCQM